MMARHSVIGASGVIALFGAAGPVLDEVGFSAWLAQAAPGEALVYHRGFLVVDAISPASSLAPEPRSTLRAIAATAMRAAECDLAHLVQARLGPDQFAYIAIARPKPKARSAALSTRLLAAA